MLLSMAKAVNESHVFGTIFANDSLGGVSFLVCRRHQDRCLE